MPTFKIVGNEPVEIPSPDATPIPEVKKEEAPKEEAPVVTDTPAKEEAPVEEVVLPTSEPSSEPATPTTEQ